MNKAIKFLSGDTKIRISKQRAEQFGVPSPKLKSNRFYQFIETNFKLNPDILAQYGVDSNRANDSAVLMFIKGEGTSVNMNNKNLKNTITIKIDKVPLVKIIMKSLYSHEGRNLVNESILIKRPLEADLVLYNFTMILNNCIVACQHWYKQYFGFDKNELMTKK